MPRVFARRATGAHARDAKQVRDACCRDAPSKQRIAAKGDALPLLHSFYLNVRRCFASLHMLFYGRGAALPLRAQQPAHEYVIRMPG